MKRLLIRLGTLAGVFILAVLVFSALYNREKSEETRELTGSSLPLVNMVEDGYAINQMNGYLEEMELSALRDSLTLLPSDRNLTVQVETCGYEIQNLDYQLLSLVDGSLIENGRIKNLTREDGQLQAEFTIANPILLDQEYMLEFDLDLGSHGICHYYTRLVQRSGQELAPYLEYVRDFYVNCIGDSLTADEISNLEPDHIAGNSSMHTLDIHSEVAKLTWGDMDVELMKRAVPTVREINATTASITQTYVVASRDEEGLTSYFTVTEFYRMRLKQGAVVLLDFNRETTELFDASQPVLSDDGLNLGVTGAQVTYQGNASAEIAAFVTNGTLWVYDRSANRAVRVYGFSGYDSSEYRQGQDDHAIRIVSVSEDGDIVFLVYGYMAGEQREGQNGLGVYEFHAERNVVEEKLFLPIDGSYSYIKNDLDRLCYCSADGQLYCYLEETIYRIDLATGRSEEMLTGISEDCLIVSDDCGVIAWMDQMDAVGSTSMTVHDLENGEELHVEAPAGQNLKVLGFMNRDIVYGLAEDGALIQNADGRKQLAMYKVCIIDTAGNLLKEYEADGYCVTGITTDEELMELKRVAVTKKGYEEAESDHIIYRGQDEAESISIGLEVDDVQGTEVYLVLSVDGENKNLLSMKSRMLVRDDGKETVAETVHVAPEGYRVYGNGQLQTVTDSAAEAVQLADSCVGVVLNQQQAYIWERGNYASSAMLDPASLPAELLSAPADADALQKILGSNAEILNLSGCELDTLYYFLDHGSAVVAELSEDTTVLMVGYDIYNVWFCNPDTLETYAMAKEDAEAAFAAMKKIFYTYKL